MQEPAETAKRAVRARMREQRLTRSREHHAAAPALTARLARLCESSRARTVTAYLSRPGEPDTRGFLEWARGHDVRALLPVSRPDGTLDWAADDGSEVLDDLGMPASAGPLLGARAIDEATLALVPAAAVARDGTRLGWGMGFFDRALASMPHRPPVYAVIFDEELVDELPREAHDIPVDGVVAPSGVTVFQRSDD